MGSRPPYYQRPGGGRRTINRDAATLQLAKRTQSTPATRAPQIPLPAPTPPLPSPAAPISVDDPLELDGTTLALSPATEGHGGWIMTTGDLSGSGGAPVVVGLHGNPVDGSPPSTGDALCWNGSEWAPAPSGLGANASFPAAFTTSQTLSGAGPYSAFDTTGGALTATLPTASSYVGPPLTVKLVAGGGSLTLATQSGDTVDGGGTATVTNVQQSLTAVVRGDGLGWYLIHPQP